MAEEHTIQVELASERKPKPNEDGLGFGRHFTDHMFIMDYTEGKGWHDPRIVPYQPLSLDPSCMIFHYGQSVFEGLKAYRTEDDRILLFRPTQNFQRLNRSNDRMCIPAVDEDLALEALKQLVAVDKEWVPSAEGTSLYIRPFIISTEPFLGVAPAHNYKFIIIMSPVGSYYAEGIKPVKILVENKFVRAVAGGTGEAKTGGNYASSLKAQEVADEKKYSQVLWLDGVEKKYIEEVGSMNVFFKINGEIVTPALNGSILDGITRKSTIEMLKHWGMKVTERRVSMEEIYEASQSGQLEESFGTGTAAVISPIGEFLWEDRKIVVNNGEIGSTAKKLYDTITGIQKGAEPDPFNWVVEVEEQSVPVK
ncbi:branched-chain amino acid aminotransferase [Bacillus thermotolerans]|uniref:branched-chain amino acid aminotransferase n=1 Tax=Bacillus thermotolerans TaxID=1221996 RepID=UPI00057F14E8|nr:branched-chain amino acid aminotransferase [Bacillus thermotolerans]KKB34301.1 Branched-chain amino acid aminotransferase [Bacillus thermotolerans]KKB42028.1 Branched-chain amino acid aminotransferase [Bacillus thermotolerans]